jgi:myo-inositol-1(or 4)-monophosphatase
MNNPLETTFFDKAVKFAIEAHQGTERRGKGYPYIIHPMEAASIVATITNDQEMLAAAVLHDTVEDTDVTIEQIREQFGDRVAELVQHETAPLDDSLSWREKKSAQIKQLVDAPYDCKVVALGDKLSNMRVIAWDYRKMGDEVWKLFHAPNGKTDVEWYYRSLGKALSELSDTLAYQEYIGLLEEVFG